MALDFVAPHPDDVALSCGGLTGSLRERGQDIAIFTVFSAVAETAQDGEGADLTPYQREAFGFGTKTHWPNAVAFNRTNLEQRPPSSLTSPPPSVSLGPEYDDISDVLELEIIGIRLRQCQLARQFGGKREMDEVVRAFGAKVGRLGGLDGAAECHWASARL
jgi:hypothetical protein